MTKNKKLLIFVALISMVGFILPPFSGAQDITYNPQLYLSGEYNDNIRFSSTDKEDDFIYSITPVMELNYSSELFNLNSLGVVQFVRYHSESDADREDYYIDLKGTYRMTERLRFRGKLDYLKDFSLETRNIDQIDTGIGEDPIEDPVTERGIENFLSERNRYNALASLNYQLTELSNLSVGYRYLDVEYDLEDNTDYVVNDLYLTYMRNLAGQKDQIGTKLNYTRRSSDVSDTDSYETGLIWKHIYTETITLYTNIGLRYSEETFKNSDQKDDDWGGTADIRLRKLGETNVMNIALRQGLQTASSGSSANVTRLYGDVTQRLSQRFVVSLNGDFYITREDGDFSSDIDTVTFDVNPSLRYVLAENYAVRLSYNYTIKHDRRVEENRDRERNSVWIAFEFGFPNKW